ncbi:MAG: aspartate kinase [Peptococcaceae bacterium]|nr:aspartate kinase [Peptococcaceae bacterium]
MNILVQKFGGTSLSSQEKRLQAAGKVVQAVGRDYAVVVVVSAMGREGDPYATDTLVSVAKAVSPDMPKREMDMLMSCGEVISGAVMVTTLQSLGLEAVLLTGVQAGIVTNGTYGDARIVRVEPEGVLAHLSEKRVVVVPGFQGASESGELTTLGRGGSDTSAAALGVALGAEAIEIFTDVEGIMTADPRMVEDARILAVVSYNDIANLAHQGAKVIHPRAVEIAMQRNVPLRVRSTFSDSPGTVVTNSMPDVAAGSDVVGDRVITGIACTPDLTQIQIDLDVGLEDGRGSTPQVCKKIFRGMALADVSVDFISVQPERVCYTVRNEWADKAVGILCNMGFVPRAKRDCAKISLVGGGIADLPGVMATVLDALEECGVMTLQSADSHTTVWVLVEKEHMVAAVQAMHRKFQLGT